MAMVKKRSGLVLVETILVIVPYLALTLGCIEYVWYLNVKTSLAAAADAAVHAVALDHNEFDGSSLGTSPQSLEPFLATATAQAHFTLLSMGYSESFVASVTVTADFIQRYAQLNQRYSNRGIPQKEGRRLIGAQVSVPYDNAMIFGGFSGKILQMTTSQPERLSVVAFMWKQWKREA